MHTHLHELLKCKPDNEKNTDNLAILLLLSLEGKETERYQYPNDAPAPEVPFWYRLTQINMEKGQ